MMDNEDKNIVQIIFEFVTAVSIAAILISIFFIKFEKPAEPKPKENKPVIITDTFSEASFKYEIGRNNIKFPEIVYAQARLETGNFNSSIFKERNNLFGFRRHSEYIKYENWQKSVEDYANWQRKYYHGGDYFQFLKDIGYAEDSSYIKKVKSCIK